MGTHPSKQVPSVAFPKLLKKLGENKLMGKNIAITGTTSGTGYHAAKACLKLGATVYMLNRKSSRSEKALNDMREISPNVFSVECDLMSLKSSKKGGENLHNELNGKGLDALCLNAGISSFPDQATEDGYDVQIQVNHYSQMMIFSQVIEDLNDAIRLRGDARVITHSSLARFMTGQQLDVKYFEKNGGNLGGDGLGRFLDGPRMIRYHHSKLANTVMVLALRDLAKEQGSKIRFFSAHPGASRTNLAANEGTGTLTGNWMMYMMRFAQSGEDGACGIMRGIADDDVENGFLYGPLGWGSIKGDAKKTNIEKEELSGNMEARKMLMEMTLKALDLKEFKLN